MTFNSNLAAPSTTEISTTSASAGTSTVSGANTAVNQASSGRVSQRRRSLPTLRRLSSCSSATSLFSDPFAEELDIEEKQRQANQKQEKLHIPSHLTTQTHQRPQQNGMEIEFEGRSTSLSGSTPASISVDVMPPSTNSVRAELSAKRKSLLFAETCTTTDSQHRPRKELPRVRPDARHGRRMPSGRPTLQREDSTLSLGIGSVDDARHKSRLWKARMLFLIILVGSAATISILLGHFARRRSADLFRAHYESDASYVLQAVQSDVVRRKMKAASSVAAAITARYAQHEDESEDIRSADSVMTSMALNDFEAMAETQRKLSGSSRLSYVSLVSDDGSAAPVRKTYPRLQGHDDIIPLVWYNVDEYRRALKEVIERNGTAVLTDIILVRQGNVSKYGTVALAPVYSNFSNEVTVGAVMVDFFWSDMLADIGVPSGTICQVRTQTTEVTFATYQNGTVSTHAGIFDDFEGKIDETGRGIDVYLNTDTNSPQSSLETRLYKFTTYAGDDYRSVYSNRIPGSYVAVVLCLVFIASATFIAYDSWTANFDSELVELAQRNSQVVRRMYPSFVRGKVVRHVNSSTEEINKSSRALMSTGSSQRRLRRRSWSVDDESLNEKDSAKSVKMSDTGVNFPDSNVNSCSAAVCGQDTEGGRGESAVQEGKGDSVMSASTYQPIASFFPSATVFFADLAGFTRWSAGRPPQHVFQLLEHLFAAFDSLAEEHGVFKVETIGDCYMAATGLPDHQPDHAERMCGFAMSCRDKFARIKGDLETDLGSGVRMLELRIGCHSGGVTAGVLRGQRARFQLFGNTVYKASKMEATSKNGMIQISNETANLLVSAGREAWLTRRQDTLLDNGERETFWVGNNQPPLDIQEKIIEAQRAMKEKYGDVFKHTGADISGEAIQVPSQDSSKAFSPNGIECGEGMKYSQKSPTVVEKEEIVCYSNNQCGDNQGRKQRQIGLPREPSDSKLGRRCGRLSPQLSMRRLSGGETPPFVEEQEEVMVKSATAATSASERVTSRYSREDDPDYIAAIAVACSPPVKTKDEPTSNIDDDHRSLTQKFVTMTSGASTPDEDYLVAIAEACASAATERDMLSKSRSDDGTDKEKMRRPISPVPLSHKHPIRNNGQPLDEQKDCTNCDEDAISAGSRDECTDTRVGRHTVVASAVQASTVTSSKVRKPRPTLQRSNSSFRARSA